VRQSRLSSEGYGYAGARNDTAQQTNICLGTHRQTYMATFNPTCLPRFLSYRRIYFSRPACCRWCERYMMFASDDDGWEKLLLVDNNLCLKLIPYCNSIVLLFQYLPVKFNFSRISFQRFGLRSLLRLFLCLWSPNGGISLTSSIREVSSTARILGHMLTEAGVWPDCRLETNLFCWARQ